MTGRTRTAATVLAALLLALGACDTESSSGSNVDGSADREIDGESVYISPVEDGNTFTCDTCHALAEPAADGVVRPGHPIGDAMARPSYKRGQLTDARDAVNNCLEHWMNAEPWSEDDARWIALRDWLDAMAPADAEALDYAVVQPPSEVAGGDAARGRDVFNGRCVVCHGQDGAGTRKAPAVAGLGLAPDYVATRIRTSGASANPIYDGLSGGIMPFWAEDRLSDEQLRDLVAYLGRSDGGGQDAGATGDVIDAGAGAGGCRATHAKVGRSADFVMNFHDVGGTATIIDDCTIEITDFTYDGTGIDVRLYGGLGSDYSAGFAMSGDLLRSGGYDGATLRATVPEGRTLDDLDGISVWCVDVGVSFGEATF